LEKELFGNKRRDYDNDNDDFEGDEERPKK